MTRHGSILVVDDEEIMREILETLLIREGYDVRLASSGAEALALARALPFDAALVDIMMPGLDGYETCAALKGDPQLANIPVILISATTDLRVVDRADKVGATTVLSKPAPIEQIEQALILAFESLRQSAAARAEALDYAGALDTLAALRHARGLGQAHTLALCNVPESALVRASSLRFLTRAGPEIGVASTKAFTTQLAALALLTLVIAKLKGRLSTEREVELLLPVWIRNAIYETGIRNVACAGGVFMNVKANLAVLQIPELEQLYIAPSCGDESNSIGAAMMVAGLNQVFKGSLGSGSPEGAQLGTLLVGGINVTLFIVLFLLHPKVSSIRMNHGVGTICRSPLVITSMKK